MNAVKEVKYKVTFGYYIKYLHRFSWQPKKLLLSSFGKTYHIGI